MIGQRSKGNNINKKPIVFHAVVYKFNPEDHAQTKVTTTATLQDNIEVPHTTSVI